MPYPRRPLPWDLHLLAYALAQPQCPAPLLPLYRACLEDPAAPDRTAALLLAARDFYSR